MNELVILGDHGSYVGALAKLLVPGKDPGGFFTTMIIGIVGAFLGGFISSFLGFGTIEQMGIIGDLIFATVGAVILLIRLPHDPGQRQ